MHPRSIPALLLTATLAGFSPQTLAASGTEIDFSRTQPGEAMPGGSASHRKAHNRRAFSHPNGNMPFEQRLDFRVGNGIFKKIWVSSPSSTTANDGLGPLYNARACSRCHIGNGRGHPPEDNADSAVSMFLRLSIPPQDEQQRQALASGRVGVIPEPTYGTQLQDAAVRGLKGEGRMRISYREIPLILSEGEQASLRAPEYRVSDLNYGPLHPQAMLSPRVTPAMIGLGLLEQIPAAAIEAAADPQDSDGDGISGRANRVWNQQTGQSDLGRFGWKAGMPNLNQQNVSAFNGDIGIATPAIPRPQGDCTAQQSQCLQMPNGNSEMHDNVEASRVMTDLLLLYTRNIAVPKRRDVAAPEVLAGKQAFYQAGCQRCHTPSFTTANNPTLPQLSQQKIWPYSDLLLHDMGEGLADNRPEFSATGREWRTPPLWGIGLTETVSGHSYYLHDGRARNLLEAILWHGGEAAASQQAVIAMPKTQRHNLIRFLESL